MVRPLSLLEALCDRRPLAFALRGRQLPAQQRQGSRRRLHRAHGVLRRRRQGPRDPLVDADIPRAVPREGRDVGEALGARALPRRLLRGADRRLLHIPHDGYQHLLQPRGRMGGHAERTRTPHSAELRDDAPLGRGEGGVRDHRPLHAARPRQPHRLDGGSLRPRQVRRAARLRIPEAEADLRPGAGRGAHRPEPGDFRAAFTLEPARLGRHTRRPARHTDREVAALCSAALPQGRDWRAAGA